MLLFFPRSRGDEPRRSDGSPAELQHFGMPKKSIKRCESNRQKSTAVRGIYAR